MNGKRIWSMLVVLAGAALSAAGTGEEVRYWYDGAGRLTDTGYSSEAGTASVRYEYDANGDLTNLLVLGQGDTTNADSDDLLDVDEYAYFARLDHTGAGDPDGDGLVTSNELAFGSDPGVAHTDNDGVSDYEEWVAGTIPTDADSYFHVTHDSPVAVYFDSSTGRVYTLQGATNLVEGMWTNVPGAGPRAGVGAADSMQDTNEPPAGSFYRVEVQLP